MQRSVYFVKTLIDRFHELKENKHDQNCTAGPVGTVCRAGIFRGETQSGERRRDAAGIERDRSERRGGEAQRLQREDGADHFLLSKSIYAWMNQGILRLP